MKATARDMEILGDLIAAYNQALRFDREGVAPLDFGGTNSSDHSYRATKLVALGYVEHRKRGYAWGKAPGPGRRYRGSKVYRPTAAGLVAHAEWRAEAARAGEA